MRITIIGNNNIDLFLYILTSIQQEIEENYTKKPNEEDEKLIRNPI